MKFELSCLIHDDISLNLFMTIFLKIYYAKSKLIFDTYRRSKQNDSYEKVVSSWELFFQMPFYSSLPPLPVVVPASLSLWLA